MELLKLTATDRKVLAYVSHYNDIDSDRISASTGLDASVVKDTVELLLHHGVLTYHGYGISHYLFGVDTKYHFAIKVSKNSVIDDIRQYMNSCGFVTKMQIVTGEMDIVGEFVVSSEAQAKRIISQLSEYDLEVLDVSMVLKDVIDRGVQATVLPYISVKGNIRAIENDDN